MSRISFVIYSFFLLRPLSFEIISFADVNKDFLSVSNIKFPFLFSLLYSLNTVHIFFLQVQAIEERDALQFLFTNFESTVGTWIDRAVYSCIPESLVCSNECGFFFRLSYWVSPCSYSSWVFIEPGVG